MYQFVTVLAGTDRRALNLASYNYLGFAEGCADITEEVVKVQRWREATW